MQLMFMGKPSGFLKKRVTVMVEGLGRERVEGKGEG